MLVCLLAWYLTEIRTDLHEKSQNNNWADMPHCKVRVYFLTACCSRFKVTWSHIVIYIHILFITYYLLQPELKNTGTVTKIWRQICLISSFILTQNITNLTLNHGYFLSAISFSRLVALYLAIFFARQQICTAFFSAHH